MNENVLDSFFNYMKSERGLSKNTIASYSSDLRLLQKHMKLPLAKATSKDIILAIKNIGNKATSTARLLSTIKAFFSFLKEENFTIDNVILQLPTPKTEKNLPTTIRVAEVKLLLNAIDINSLQGLRDKAILVVLYCCGLRASECINLHISDLQNNYIKVLGKGNKERIVPICKWAKELLVHYINRRKDVQTELFLSDKNKKITRFMVYNILKKYCKQVGLEISPHSLRHSFATHLAQNGADIRIVQELLGHADIATAEHYIHIQDKELQEHFNKYHPR